jgi:hypothetical protein
MVRIRLLSAFLVIVILSTRGFETPNNAKSRGNTFNSEDEVVVWDDEDWDEKFNDEFEDEKGVCNWQCREIEFSGRRTHW